MVEDVTPLLRVQVPAPHYWGGFGKKLVLRLSVSLRQCL